MNKCCSPSFLLRNTCLADISVHSALFLFPLPTMVLVWSFALSVHLSICLSLTCNNVQIQKSGV